MNLNLTKNPTIAVIGLGYVGLPLALAFSKIYKTIGYDTNVDRIEELGAGFDRTGEADQQELQASGLLSYSINTDDILDADIYIVTVPTPVDKYKRPDLQPLLIGFFQHLLSY